MQTMADLEERLGSVAAARKVIGNLNNMVALRTKDGLTRDVFTETMGKTYIKHVDTSLSTHADNYSGIPSYNAGASLTRALLNVKILFPASITACFLTVSSLRTSAAASSISCVLRF